MGSLTLSKKSDMVYSLIQNFTITKPGITWESRGESHRNVSCTARVCWAGKGCRRKLELHLLPLSKLLLTLMLKHWPPQLKTSKLFLVEWQTDDTKTLRTSLVLCFILIFIFRWTGFAVHLHNQEIMWIHKREGTKRALRQGRDTACWNKHFGNISKATNWLFLSPLSFSCVLQINHSLIFLK